MKEQEKLKEPVGQVQPDNHDLYGNNPEQTALTPSQNNWNFYNQLQATQPQTSHGGKNITNPTTKKYKKKRRIKRTQRNSRRINRKK